MFSVLAGWGLLGSRDLSVPHCRAPLGAHGQAPRPSGRQLAGPMHRIFRHAAREGFFAALPSKAAT